jgi:hypothetical protein
VLAYAHVTIAAAASLEIVADLVNFLRRNLLDIAHVLALAIVT